MTAPATARETRPCGHCKLPVEATPGRTMSSTWWCNDPDCQRARRNAGAERHRAERRPRVEKVGRCENCGGPYRGKAHRPARVGKLCRRRACAAERERRTRQLTRTQTEARPCAGCNTPVQPGRYRQEGHRWWCPRCRTAAVAHRKIAVVIGPEVGADVHGLKVPSDAAWPLIHGIIACSWTRAWIATQITGLPATGLGLSETCTPRTMARLRAAADYAAVNPGPSAHARREAAEKGWTPAALWDDLGHGDDQPEDQPIPFRR